MSKERDLGFEMLATVCGMDYTNLQGSARGALNKALAEIRSYLPDLEHTEVAMVIEQKAVVYRQVMGGVMLTPTALAKHWPQLDHLKVDQERVAVQQVNGSAPPSDCRTCNGDRMVLKFYRPAPNPHPAHSAPTDGFEEWGPCPDCNQTGVGIVEEYRRRFDRIHGDRKPPSTEGVAALRAVLRG